MHHCPLGAYNFQNKLGGAGATVSTSEWVSMCTQATPPANQTPAGASVPGNRALLALAGSTPQSRARRNARLARWASMRIRRGSWHARRARVGSLRTGRGSPNASRARRTPFRTRQHAKLTTPSNQPTTICIIFLTGQCKRDVRRLWLKRCCWRQRQH